MSCCSSGNPTDFADVAAVQRARERLTDPLMGTDQVIWYTPRQTGDCITPVSGCAETHDCTPIPAAPLCPREYRLCADQNGCATRYPADCRSLFWPDFCHPRWLPCSCLYCTRKCCTRKPLR